MKIKLPALLPPVGKLGISTGEISCFVNEQYPIQFIVNAVSKLAKILFPYIGNGKNFLKAHLSNNFSTSD